MRKKIGLGFIIVGMALVMGALSFYLYQLWLEERAGDAAADVLAQLKKSIEADPDSNTDTDGISAADGDSDQGSGTEGDENLSELRVVTIDGYDYIGYLTIEDLGLELPVMAEYSMEGLDVSPGRYSGSILTDDMVIAGHNYRRHFSAIKWAAIGTEVVFTDMDGQGYCYEIAEIETLQPTQIEKLIGEDDYWDLTLFTCTTSGTARCVVRCVRTHS